MKSASADWKSSTAKTKKLCSSESKQNLSRNEIYQKLIFGGALTSALLQATETKAPLHSQQEYLNSNIDEIGGMLMEELNF